jgi:hypothetical protein
VLFIFIVFFEFSTGPVIWLYIGEISNDVSAGIATAVNAAANLLIPNLLQSLLNNNDADNSSAERANPYHPA